MTNSMFIKVDFYYAWNTFNCALSKRVIWNWTGRINQCELQTLLNIDITHIEKKVSEIVKHDASLVLILGQIISKDYMNKIAQEINEMLQERSRITVAELTTVYDLPRDFMLEILTPRVGSIINGNFDGENFYTLNFVSNQRALLAGALEACIKPIRIGQLVKEYNLENAMVFGKLLLIFSKYCTRGVSSKIFKSSIRYRK